MKSQQTFFKNASLKPRQIPIQLRQSGDLGGDGIDIEGHRMLIDARTRKGPFHHLSQRAGAWCWTHYNRMYHPRCVMSKEEGGMDAEYEHLTTKVALINVAVERQIQVKGPDAEAFVDRVITRRADKIKPGTAKYAILCNKAGGIINDPVLLRLKEDEFWFSLADSDAGLYLQGVNALGAYDVEVQEIDVAPLSLAGPLALDTMISMIGEEAARNLAFYHFLETRINGCDVVVARTGFSSEANFEIYLRDATRDAEKLYDAIMDAGKQFGIREIAIPHHSRIEGGMLSYGQDIDIETNPYECGLGWMVNLKKKSDFVGKAALATIKAEGATHKLAGLRLGGEPINWYPADFFHVYSKDNLVGYVTSAWYSPVQKSNIAFAMLPVSQTEMGTELEVAIPSAYKTEGMAQDAGDGSVVVQAVVCPVPFKKMDNAEARTSLIRTQSKFS